MAVRKKTVKKAEKSEVSLEVRPEYVDELESTVKALLKARDVALDLLKSPSRRIAMPGRDRDTIVAAIKVLEGTLK